MQSSLSMTGSVRNKGFSIDESRELSLFIFYSQDRKNSYSSAQGKEYLEIFSAGKKISKTLIILMCVLDPSLGHSLRVY